VPYERLQRDEELLGFLGIEVSVRMYGSSVIDDADVHGVGVQIDSAVEFVLLIVELHIMFFLERVSLSHETSEAAPSNLIFKALTLMDESTRSSRDMMSINPLHTEPRAARIGAINVVRRGLVNGDDSPDE